jgi:hypothetical protein
MADTVLDDSTMAGFIPASANIVVPAAAASPASTATTKQKTPAQQAASAKFNEQFLGALNVTFWEKTIAAGHKLTGGDAAAGSYIISKRTPEEVLNAFEKTRPEWKPALDEIRKDPRLLKATHNVLAKDETMLEAFSDIVSDIGNGNPQDFADVLKDGKKRKALSVAFDRIAEKKELTGKDFRELYNNRHDQAKTMAKLQQMGVGFSDMMDADFGFKMLTDFFRDPVGFLKKLPDMLQSMGYIGPIQTQAIKESGFMKFAQATAGVTLGPISGDPKGFGGHIADALESGKRYIESGRAQDDIDRLSGEADKKALLIAGTGKPADRATSMGSKIEVGSKSALATVTFKRAAEGSDTAEVIKDYAPRNIASTAPVPVQAFGA